MNPTILEHKSEVEELCRRYNVKRLELFGSATGESFDPGSSDLDFLVEFGSIPEGRYADTYFDLLERLEHLFSRPVDLVVTSAIKNPYFRQSVEQSRTLLYAA